MTVERPIRRTGIDSFRWIYISRIAQRYVASFPRRLSLPCTSCPEPTLTSESLLPLIVSTSSYGLHGPILDKMETSARKVAEGTTSTDLENFISLLAAVRSRPRFKMPPSLFSDTPSTEERRGEVDFHALDARVGPVDAQALADVLGFQGGNVKDVAGALRRMEKLKSSKDAEEAEEVPEGTRVERGVREL